MHDCLEIIFKGWSKHIYQSILSKASSCCWKNPNVQRDTLLSHDLPTFQLNTPSATIVAEKFPFFLLWMSALFIYTPWDPQSLSNSSLIWKCWKTWGVFCFLKSAKDRQDLCLLGVNSTLSILATSKSNSVWVFIITESVKLEIYFSVSDINIFLTQCGSSQGLWLFG